MTPLPPNALAFNILDTAQLDPGYVMDLANSLDVAQVTIIQATHPAQAFSLAQRFRKERPQTNVFYRKWKKDLPDENMVNQTRPDEWLNYFQDVLDIGCYGCIYNESLTTPISKQNNYAIEVLNLTVPKGYRTVHFKVSTGNPGGYNKEYLLPKDDPHYRPDEYDQSDALWTAIYQANHPAIDRGDFPMAWVAPHMYFTQAGAAAGMTDRYKEIFRRLDIRAIPHKYIPLAAGEFGMVYQRNDGSLDSGKGFNGIVSSEIYAELYSSIYKSELKPGDVIPHLFSLGDQQTANNAPGQWHFFNTLYNGAFWKRIQEIAGTGAFRLSSWYAMPPPPPIITPPPPVEPPPPPAAHVWTPAQIVQLEHWRDTLVSNIASDTAHLEIVQKMLSIAKGI